MAISNPVDLGTVTGAGTSATQDLVVTAGCSVGDRIVVTVGSSITTRLISTVTDTRGNTYAVDKTQNDATQSGNLYFASSACTTALQVGDTITVTFATTNASTRQVAAMAIPGGGVLHGSNGRVDAGGSDVNTLTVPVSVANSIVIGATTMPDATAIITWNAPATKFQEFSGNSRTLSNVYDIKTTAGTYGFTGTSTVATNKMDAVVVYEEAAIDPNRTAADTVTFTEAAAITGDRTSTDTFTATDDDAQVDDPGSTVEGTLSEEATVSQETAVQVTGSDTFGVTDTAAVQRPDLRPDTTPPTDAQFTEYAAMAELTARDTEVIFDG